MKRVLEPEIMDGEEQSSAYAQADFSDSNQWYVDHLMDDFPGYLGNLVDLGCGPADVDIRIAKKKPDSQIIAVDGSEQMIKIAQQAVRAAGFEQQIMLRLGYIPGLPLSEHSFDAILSKDLLHHLPDPSVFWNEAKRLGKRGAAVYVMDLHRPSTPEAARQIVENVSAHEPPIVKEDFYNSLCAAFTVEEVEEQLRKADLRLEIIAKATERHLLIKGLLP